MVKIKKRVLGLALVGIMSLGSVATIISEIGSSKMVQAQEKEEYPQLRSKAGYQIKSSQGNTAYNKIRQIITSIKKNYAGIKNQPTWQKYIKEARNLINKIPSKYKQDAVELTKLLDDIDNFVNYVAKMNHVEKSYETQYKGIKNSAQWGEYLDEAIKYRNNIKWYYKDMEEILYKVEEVDARFDAIDNKVYLIEKAHYDALAKIAEKYNRAEATNNLSLAKEALEDAKKLGTHSSTTEAIKAINELIEYLS